VDHPSEIGDALKGLGSTLGATPGVPQDSGGPKKRIDLDAPVVPDNSASLSRAHQEVQEAIESARLAEPQARSGGGALPGSAMPPAAPVEDVGVDPSAGDPSGSQATPPS
jgi:hypothetical protein